MTAKEISRLLDIDLKIDSCEKCPFVRKGRCHAENKEHGLPLSRDIYSISKSIYRGFMERTKRDPNCPLLITVRPGD